MGLYERIKEIKGGRVEFKWFATGTDVYQVDAEIDGGLYIIKVRQEENRSVFLLDGRCIEVGCVLEGGRWRFTDHFEMMKKHRDRCEMEWFGIERLIKEIKILRLKGDYWFWNEMWVKGEEEGEPVYKKKIGKIELDIKKIEEKMYEICIGGQSVGNRPNLDSAVNVSVEELKKRLVLDKYGAINDVMVETFFGALRDVR